VVQKTVEIIDYPGQSKSGARKLTLNWLGILPFLLFALLFLLLPTLNIVVGAFRTPQGTFTLDNIANLGQPRIIGAFWVSVKLSFASAIVGCVLGFALAAAVVMSNLPTSLRAPLLTFSGVASNFAGVPLAFAFIATLGRVGILTVILKSLGFDLYGTGFNLISFSGLVLVYTYFQIPLMVLIIVPALDGLKKEWREAAEILGATQVQYWRIVAFPILLPALLGTFALLFANAFGAIATATALTGSQLSIVPIVLFNQIRGDVLQDPQLGYAIAFGMIVVTALTNFLYLFLRARSERWMKQ
jgi:putative spermidine/putrescine transport system permease protein